MGFLDRIFAKAPKPSANGHAPRFIVPPDEDELHDFMSKAAGDDVAFAAWANSPGYVGKPGEAAQFLSYYENFCWIYIAIRARAQNAASVPLRCVRYKNDDTTENLPKTHPLSLLINNPNDIQTRREFIEMMVTHLDTTGKCVILMDDKPKPQSMYLLRPDLVNIVPDPVRFIKGFEYNVNRKKFFYTWPDQAWYHRHLDPGSDYDGLSPIAAVRRSIISEDFIQRWTLATFKNNCRVDQVLETDSEMDPKIKRRQLAEFFQAFKGADNQGKTAILSNGLKLKPYGLPPKDTEFLALRKFNWREQLGVYGVPPVVAGITEEVNYATANEQRRGFWEHTECPMLNDLAEAMTKNIARRFGDDLGIEFDYSGIEALKEAANDRAARLTILRNGGALSANEMREEFGWESIDTPVMNGILVPSTSRLVDPETGEDVLAPVTPPSPPPGQGGGPNDQQPPVDQPPGKSGAKSYGSREYRELAWKVFDRSARRQIKGFRDGVADFFTEQKGRVLARFSHFGPTHANQKDASNIGFDPFDFEEEARLFLKKMRKEYLAAINDAGETRIDDLSLPTIPAFNTASNRIASYISHQAASRIRDINQETVVRVREVIHDGVQAGDSIDQIARRLEVLYDGFNVPLSENAPRFTRADVIARTEVNASLNFGNHEAEHQAVESGAKLVKQWIANPRPTAREEHVQIGDDTASDPIPWGQPFSNGLMFPMDPNGPADEVINCTCSSISYPSSITLQPQEPALVGS